MTVRYLCAKEDSLRNGITAKAVLSFSSGRRFYCHIPCEYLWSEVSLNYNEDLSILCEEFWSSRVRFLSHGRDREEASNWVALA